MKLNIMTYNIASGRYYANDCDINQYGGAVVDLEQCAKVIRELSPEFCGINEINHYEQSYVDNILKGGTDTDQTGYLAKYTGLLNKYFSRAISFENRGAYGNAVISKAPILSAETIAIPDPEIKDETRYYETRGIAKVKLDIAGGITVLQVHVGLAIAESQNAIVELCRIIDETEGPIILMGDFNMCPSNFLFDRIRERLNEITPDGEGYIHSFPSWTHEANISANLKNHPDGKIDYIFASKHFKKISCEIPEIRVSDHKPMIATLEI